MATAILRKAMPRRLTAMAQLYTSTSPAPQASRIRPPIVPLPPDRYLTHRILNPSSRVRLDGLVPPPPPAQPAIKLEQAEVRKVLRATQMEAARASLRAAAASQSCVSYPEFLQICSDAVGPESGARVAKALDESGSVVVLGQTVLLRPEMVRKAIEDAIPQKASPSIQDDELRQELQEMEEKKAEIDRKAATQVRAELWAGLGMVVVQTVGFMRLTFWELSWDVMEPICFFVTSMYFMGGYAFFLRTNREPSFEGLYQSRFATRQKSLMKAQNFDIGRYDELRRISAASGMMIAPARCPPAASHDIHYCTAAYCHCH